MLLFKSDSPNSISMTRFFEGNPGYDAPSYITSSATKGEVIKTPISTTGSPPFPFPQSAQKYNKNTRVASPEGRIPPNHIPGRLRPICNQDREIIINEQGKELQNSKHQIKLLETQLNNAQVELECSRHSEKLHENEINEAKDQLLKLKKDTEKLNGLIFDSNVLIEDLKQQIAQLNIEKERRGRIDSKVQNKDKVRQDMTPDVSKGEAEIDIWNENEEKVKKELPTMGNSDTTNFASPSLDDNNLELCWKQEYNSVREENNRLREEINHLELCLNSKKNKEVELASVEEKLTSTLAAYVCARANLDALYKEIDYKSKQHKPSITEQLQALENTFQHSKFSEEFI